MFILFILAVVVSFVALEFYQGSRWQPESDSVTGTICKEVWNKDGELTFKPYGASVRILVKVTDTAGLNGKVVELKGSFFEPEGERNPGGYDYRRYLLGKNVTFLSESPEIKVKGNAFSVRILGSEIRQYINEAVTYTVGDEYRGFLTGVMTGDTSGIGQEEKQWIRLSGISHIMAVSGTHVTYILMPMKSLVKKRNLDIAMRSALCLIPLFLFVMIAGFTPSVVRAGVMCGADLISKIANCRNDPLNSLGLAGLVCFILYPYAVADIGFLLSFGAVLSGMILLPVLKRIIYREKEPVKALEGLLYGVSVNIGLMPIMMYYFNMISPAGVLITLVAAPLSAIMCIFGYLTVIFYYIPFLKGLADILGAGLTAVTKGLTVLAEWGAGIPSVNTISPGICFFVIYYGIILLLCLKVNKKKINKNYIIVFLSVFVLVGTVSETFNVHQLKITWLDVGQGSSTIVETGGYRILVDGGNGYTDVSSILWKQGIRTLDYVILSHGDSDHVEGLYKVIEQHPVKNLILPDNIGDEGAAELAALAAKKNINVTWFSGKGEFLLDNVLVELFCFVEKDSLNNSSVVVQLTLANSSFLLPGDLETDGEEVLIKQDFLRKCDVVTASHHGSRSGTGYEMLSKTCPVATVISVGQQNMYGHPHPDVLKRLIDSGTYIFRTDRDGAVIMTIDNKDNLGFKTWLKKESIQFKK